MKKKIASLFLSTVCVISLAATAWGETSRGSSKWTVTFQEGNKMESNFGASDLDEVIYGMQPGDRAVLKLSLENKNSKASDWYMTNQILYSLEDRSANSATGGGAYTYQLSYTDHKGKKNTLFSSDTVGGEKAGGAGEGLKAATDALDEYFYLDTLAKGQKGQITLTVALDGETQGNDYQNTLADLAMNFAVELNDSNPTSPSGPSGSTGATPRPGTPASQLRTETIGDGGTPTAAVQTGDDTEVSPWILTACVSGGLLLAISIYGQLCGKKRQEGEE
ncbi:MAG: hypothetical protein HFH57_00680 [Lachnospiraceae bacterium]|nr:hypothetical protein [Lachnospiraceae bacterium]